MTRNYKPMKKRKRTGRKHYLRHTISRFLRMLLVLLLFLSVCSYLFPEQTKKAIQTVAVPLQEQILEPIASNTQDWIYDHKWGTLDFLETHVFEPLGLRAPWQDSDSDSEIARSAAGSSDFSVHFLDVGQGLSVLVQSGEHAMLYDGGGRDSSSYVVSYLSQLGITHLDYLIASHYDADHISGLIGVLHTTSATTILGPDYEHDSQTFLSFQNTVASLGKTILHPETGAEYMLGSSYFTILSSTREAEEANNNSIAIRIVNGKNAFVLTGDAESESEEAMCHSGLNLYCDVLCPGHHGSSSSTSSLFLAYTQPEYAVISVGAQNDYGHPHQATLQRLQDAGVTVFRTDECGTIVARSDGTTITFEML